MQYRRLVLVKFAQEARDKVVAALRHLRGDDPVPGLARRPVRVLAQEEETGCHGRKQYQAAVRERLLRAAGPRRDSLRSIQVRVSVPQKPMLTAPEAVRGKSRHQAPGRGQLHGRCSYTRMTRSSVGSLLTAQQQSGTSSLILP